VPLPAGDIHQASGRARLGYRRAEEIFKAASGGKTLHQQRHTALTLAAENGASTSMLMAYSGHISAASVIPYSRPSPEALGRWQAERDPANRRQGRR
jgi:integrase